MAAAPPEYFVKAAWDDEAQLWYVADTDVPGLATGAASVDSLHDKLQALIPELLAENGIAADSNREVGFELIATRHSRAPQPAAC